MNIILDAMGGDNSPEANIRAALRFAKETNNNIELVGKEDVINDVISKVLNEKSESRPENISIYNASEVITMEDIPTKAIKAKKDSSMVVALNRVKEGHGDVIVSAGNTGALLTGATLTIGRIKGVKRPVMSALIPLPEREFMLLDTGANTNCDENLLLQFAVMGKIYFETIKGEENAKIGLLNIGTEENKGNELYKSTYKHIKANMDEYDLNFIGNVEARDPFISDVDILVADGFTGNVFLKTLEGLGKFFKDQIKTAIKEAGFRKIFLLPLKKQMKELVEKMNYKKMGGGLFLGVKKPVVKAHGSSDETAFYYTLKQAEAFAENKVVDKIEEASVKYFVDKEKKNN